MIKVEDNLGLVHACAHKMEGKGVEYEELFGAGSEGLVKAIKGFDESRGFAFSTYAVPVIFGEMKRLFRDGGAVKISRSIKELSLKIAKEKSLLQEKLSREPTVFEIADKMSLPYQEVALCISSASPTVSLTGESGDIPVGVQGEEEKILQSLDIKRAINTLEDKDKQIITLRYFRELTQSQTAKILNMTQVQISRREKVILSKLKDKLK